MIPTLIDKSDTFEAVRDKIAQILVDESFNQQSLAIAAGRNPEGWKLRVYTERSQPWQAWYIDGVPTDRSPIVNVWYDNGSFDANSGDVISKQIHRATYNIDCYGLGVAVDTVEGHDPSDELAAKEAQRTVRLVRNILMSGVNTRLGLTGIVFRRWVSSISIFQPNLSDNPSFDVVGARLSFAVDFHEIAPQVEGQPLELISINLTRASDGSILAEADYPHLGAP